jgi:hypothetical protein
MFTNVSEVLAASIIRAMSKMMMMIEAARTSETLVYLYQTTLRYNSEDKPSSYSPL